MQTVTVDAGNWWAMSRGAQAQSWIAGYRTSLDARHRTMLVEQVRSVGAETVLEIGCHCGPNLVRLGKALPDLRMLGVDISVEAITAGRTWMAEQGLSERVQLNAGRMPGMTSGVPSESVDVVFSCYTLAYVAPVDLDAVLWEMGRIAAKAVILAEPMVDCGPSVQLHHRQGGYQEWAHNYTEAARWVGSLRGCQTRRVAVDPPVDHLNGMLVMTP